MTTRQEEQVKNYILANIDKYVVDGGGNFYWEDAEEGMKHIYESQLESWNDSEVKIKISERILETKEDWELDFIEDDIHKRPIMLFKNKKDGRIIYGSRLIKSYLVAEAINHYKGTSKNILKLLRAKSIITEEQTKLLEELEKKKTGKFK